MNTGTVVSPPASTPTPPGTGRHPKASRSAIVFCCVIAIVAVLTIAVLTVPMSRQAVGAIVIAFVILLIFVGIPVSLALIGASILGLWALGGTKVLNSTLQYAAFDAANSWSLSVIPMFILMGILLWKSGLTNSAFDAARQWFGKFPGGLAVATNFAGAGLAAGSGSTIGISYAVGRMAIPEMLRAGYRPALATGTVAAAGTLGQVIPPSIMLVIYAGIAEVPVGPQLMAGVVPGIILAVAFTVMIVSVALIKPSVAPRVNLAGVTWGTRLRSLVGVIPIVAVVLIVVGGLFAGLFTATEAGAFGMLAALIFGVAQHLRRHRSGRAALRMVWESVVTTVASTAGIFLLLIGVEILTRVIALSRIANDLAVFITDMGLSRVGLLLFLIVLYLILGMFMDTLAMMLLTVPVLLVPVTALGVDPLWFGVFIVIMAEIGLLTPPLGMLTFIVHRLTEDREVNLGKRISLTEVFKGVLLFVVAALAVVLLLIFLPDLVTWLPGLGTNS